MALDGNERRALYRNLINDPATQAETRKYSFVDWEKKLLGDEKAIGKLAKYSVGRNWAIDENDFTERYTPEFKSTPAPKQQAASVAVPVAAPVEQQAYTPPPQPAVGSPEYDKHLQAQYGGMKPTLGATFGGAPAAFETKEQKKQEQISPVFKAQKLAYQDVPIAEEQRRAQREFAKAPKEQQQAALIGSTGAELKKARQAEREGPGDRASANVEALWEGAKNAGINIFNGLKAVMNNAALNETPMDEGEREYYQQEQWGEMYRASKEAGENLQNELYRLNVSPDVLNAIDKGDYGKIPEATLQTIGNVGISAISSLLTAGGSMYFQTLPDTYREGVEAIAREKGITPEEVIRSGEDAKIAAQTTAGIIAALERAGAGRLSKSIANKGGYKAVRDFLIRNGFSKPVGRLGGLGYAGSGEFATEYAQQGAQQLGRIVAASEDASQFYQKLPKEFLSKEAFKERLGAGVAGFVGGAGVVGIGRGSARTFGSGVSLDKFSDNIANNEIIQNAARGYEDNIARAEEQGRKPEAYNQKQLKKILNDPEAWVREEIKYLKQTIESNKNLGLDSKVEENSMAKATSLLTQIKAEKKAIEEADIASAQTPAATQEEAQAVPAEEVQGQGFQIAYAKTREEIPEEYRNTIAEIERPTTRLGRFGPMEKLFAYKVPTETIDITAPEVTTEEDLAEDIPFEEIPPVTEENITEEQRIALANLEEERDQELIYNSQAHDDSRAQARSDQKTNEKFDRMRDEIISGVSTVTEETPVAPEEDEDLLAAFRAAPEEEADLLADFRAAPEEEVVTEEEAVPAEEVAPEPAPVAPVEEAAPAPKGRKKAAPAKPTPAAPKKEEAAKPEPKKEEGKKEAPFKGIASFETAKGSVYTVLPNGKTQRFKTATKEQDEPQDLTVFVKFKNPAQEQDFLEGVQKSETSGTKVYVIDLEGNKYDTNEQAAGKDVRLALVKDGKVIDTVETSTTPQIGYNTFDQRRLKKDGEGYRQVHIGNKVVKINEQTKSEAKKEETRIEQSKSRAKDSKDAKNHSADLSGEAYELEDGTGLVQGFNLMGKPVYSGYKKGKRTRVDIDSYTGDVFTAEELSALKELKKELEASEKAAQTQDPFKKQGRVAKTDSVPDNVRKLVEDITKSLGIDKKIIIITDGDFNEGQYQKHGLYGTLAQVRSAKQSASNPYEYGAKRYMSDADAFYIYYDGKLKGDQLFTVISHELGHIVEQEVFNNSSEQTKKAVKEDYEKWLASLTGKTVEEVAKETRDITLADLIEGNTRKFDASKDKYISSFSEYFADNVAKWARTSAKPKSAVDKYFSGIVEAFKKLHDYVFEKGLYSKSLFDWLDGMYEAEPTETKDGKKPAPKTKQKKYEKGKEEGGLTLNETPSGVPYLSKSGGDDYEVPSGLQWEGDRLNGEFLSVIGKWNETNYISFTGDTYVKDASDVAEIMSLLENKSVEHSFAVHVDEEGKGHVQFLNIGVLAETHMNTQAIIAGAKRFKTKKLYLVHNHPSGQLKLSDGDKAVTENIQQILAPLKVIVDHVVLNTYKKQYSVYENWGGGKYIESRGIARKEEGGKEKLTTHIFNEQQLLSRPQKDISHPLDAAKFIQQMRLTALPKSAMLLLNSGNEIIGNYFFVKGIDYKEILDIVSTSGVTRSVVFYGNQNNVAEINKISSLLKAADIKILDAITLSSNGESVVGYYESAAEKGVLNEVHEKYGTNSVPSPSSEFTSSQSSEAATAFDKAKTSKGFDKKHGKGAYKALSDITKNFDEIMDKVSDKIKQDCL
jgi:hypothetical protein